MTLNPNDISSIESESGIIGSLIQHPEFYLMTDYLTPHDFVDDENAYLYYAISELAKKGVQKIDSYSILNILNAKEATKSWAQKFNHTNLGELISLSSIIARDSLEDYRVLVDIVRSKAYRRAMLAKLSDCERLCYNDSVDNLTERIYAGIDGVVTDHGIFSDDVTPFSSKVDDMWQKLIERQQRGGLAGFPSKIARLGDYWSYEPDELVLVCAYRKEGKSIFCMNELKHLLDMGARVLYIDSEMSDSQQYVRFLSHLSGVSVSDIKRGSYTQDQKQRILDANQYLKTHNYVHCYETQLNKDKIYLLVKRLLNTTGLDFVIVDYIKSQGSTSSSEIYNILGEYTDFLKNRIAGDFHLPVLAAAQLNRGGEIADSFKIEQYASTINILRRKSEQEIMRDGASCGNYKMFVKLNRLGEQMDDINSDYIDLQFDGRSLNFSQAQAQHTMEMPY